MFSFIGSILSILPNCIVYLSVSINQNVKVQRQRIFDRNKMIIIYMKSQLTWKMLLQNLYFIVAVNIVCVGCYKSCENFSSLFQKSSYKKHMLSQKLFILYWVPIRLFSNFNHTYIVPINKNDHYALSLYTWIQDEVINYLSCIFSKLYRFVSVLAVSAACSCVSNYVFQNSLPMQI